MKSKKTQYVTANSTDLFKSNKLFASLFDTVPEVLLILDHEGNIVKANRRTKALLHYEPKELIGVPFDSLIPGIANQIYTTFPSGFFSDPQNHKIGIGQGLQAVGANQELIPVEIEFSPLSTDAAPLTCAYLHSTQVQIQNQEFLTGAQPYVKNLIEASRDPLFIISPDGKITHVNEATVSLIGDSEKKLIGTPFADYFAESDEARKVCTQAFEQGFVTDYPLSLKKNKGKPVNVIFNASAYKDIHGNPLGVFASARDVTAQKQASQYARSLIEASPDPLVTINPDGKITDVNEASVKATGIPRESLIGTDFSDYFTEPDKARQGYQKVFTKGFVVDFPLTLRNKNGRLTSVLYDASVYHDNKGKVIGAVAAARDITVLKEAEEKIRKIQAYTRSLIETSLDPQITKGADGKITDVNEATILVTGVSREDILGTNFPDYFTEPEKARDAYQQAFYKGVVRNYPLAIRHTSGKITHVLYNATVHKDEDGMVQGVFASARDITDRKQAEEELKKQQAYTRSLIEASLDPMVAISPGGKITDVNEASVIATGVKREKLIGTDFSDYFTEPEKAREAYRQVFAKGFVADYALTIRHSLKDVLYNASVYRDENGSVLGGFATARDITAIRKQEMKIKALNEELEQRIIELESFSYSVSHDLRAPLRAIDGFIAIFLDKYFSLVDQEGQRLLNNVRRNVAKMGSLIDELLVLSRIGMKDIQMEVIDMKAIVKTVLDELREMKKDTEVTVKKLDKAKGDVALIKQVLVNLVSNAFKYSRNKDNPKVEIGSINSNDVTTFYIRDNGVGFDMAHYNKLFGVFQRLHDPTEYQGTGVGLAIVKRIITRHGGEVSAQGEEGKGATFYFTLKKA